jgi:hypothetical protein
LRSFCLIDLVEDNLSNQIGVEFEIGEAAKKSQRGKRTLVPILLKVTIWLGTNPRLHKPNQLVTRMTDILLSLIIP